MHLRSLRFADLALWHGDARYSDRARHILISAYLLLRQAPNNLGRYAQAVDLVAELLAAPMSDRQLIRAWYVMGSAYSAVGDLSVGRTWISQAIELAYAQGDPGDLLDLLYLRGAINRGALRYADTARDYRAYLAIDEGEYGFHPDSLDAPIMLEVLLQLAGAEFFLAHYTDAEQLLALAAPLLPTPTSSSDHAALTLASGTYAWFQSQVYRWRGMPDLALLHAASAARIYAKLGSPISGARIQMVVADISLDIAARARQEGERRFLASVARPHVEAAYQLATEAGDPYGDCLCALVNTRLSRLSGLPEDRMAAIERVIRSAQRLDDEAIMAQAFTALGDELAGQGRLEAAAHRYHDVKMLLDGSDVPALGVWARRAAHQLAEQHPEL